ncbi:MAG: hypothetical protein ACYC7G_07320 [Rudaea sp.]
MRLAALLLLLAATAAQVPLSLGGATPGIGIAQLRAILHGNVHCAAPRTPLLPADATDIDCTRPGDLVRSGLYAGTAGGQPIHFVYRFRHGRLGSIVVLGIKPEAYAAVLAALVEKFGTPDKIGNVPVKPSSSNAIEVPMDTWTRGGNQLGLRRVAALHQGAGLWLVAQWYMEDSRRSEQISRQGK